LKKNKVLFFGKKQVPIALQEPLERWGALDWVGAKKSAF
jgi:hypothetical protein